MLFVDEFEEENGADESLLHSVEGNDSRGGATPMNGSGMMPSPVLLWRFKVFFVLKSFLNFVNSLLLLYYYNMFDAFD